MCVCVRAHSIVVVLVSCIVCPCMAQPTNQEKGVMKTRRQQEYKMIDWNPLPPACDSTVLSPMLLVIC